MTTRSALDSRPFFHGCGGDVRRRVFRPFLAPRGVDIEQATARATRCAISTYRSEFGSDRTGTRTPRRRRGPIRAKPPVAMRATATPSSPPRTASTSFFMQTASHGKTAPRTAKGNSRLSRRCLNANAKKGLRQAKNSLAAARSS